MQRGNRAAILALGAFFPLGKAAAQAIAVQTSVQPTLINPRYISGLDVDLLEQLKEDHEVIVTLEDGILDGGFGEKIARFYGRSHQKVLNYGLQKKFLDRYDVAEVCGKTT